MNKVAVNAFLARRPKSVVYKKTVGLRRAEEKQQKRIERRSTKV